MKYKRTGARCERCSSQLQVHDVVTAPALFEAQATACAITRVYTSRRRELATGTYTSHTSHPFCCSYETSVLFSVTRSRPVVVNAVNEGIEWLE